ncbi:unnamed protein product [Closterium sp. NIES-64]|nr:unnamed protein product [Closterium sp. NIES-64]
MSVFVYMSRWQQQVELAAQGPVGVCNDSAGGGVCMWAQRLSSTPLLNASPLHLSIAAGGVGDGSNTVSRSADENQSDADRTLAAAGLIRLERILKTRIATVEAMLKSLQHEREGVGEGRGVSEEKEEGEGERKERGGKEDEEDDLPSWVDTAAAAASAAAAAAGSAAAGSAAGGSSGSKSCSKAGRELVVEGDEWDETGAKDEEGMAAESGQALNTTRNNPSSPPQSPNTTLPPHLSLLLSHLTPSHLPPVCRTDPTTHSLSPISASLFPPPPRLIPWNPHPHRYLLATCTYGRTSNHLLCIRRHPLALPSFRSLVLPSPPLPHSPPPGNPPTPTATCLPHARMAALPTTCSAFGGGYALARSLNWFFFLSRALAFSPPYKPPSPHSLPSSPHRLSLPSSPSPHHPLSSLLRPSPPLFPPPPINPSLPSSPHQPLSTLLPPSTPLYPPPPITPSLPPSTHRPLPSPSSPSLSLHVLSLQSPGNCISVHPLPTAATPVSRSETSQNLSFSSLLQVPRLCTSAQLLSAAATGASHLSWWCSTMGSGKGATYLAFAALLNRSLLLPVVPPASPGASTPHEGAWFTRGLRQGSRVDLGAPPEWMDLGVALDVAGLQQCVGQGRVVTVDAYLRGEGRFIRDAPWVKLLPHGDDDGGVDTDDFTTGGSNSGDNSSTTSTGTSTGGGINNEDTNNGGGAASEANINDPAHLARVCTAAPIPASNVTLRQFLSFFGARTEQVIGLGDVFEVTGSVDVGQVGETGEDLGGVGGSLTDSLVEGHYDGVNGARDARARLLADKLLEGHASSDGLPGLYDGLNGAVPILPPCRLAMRPHPAALSAAHAFTRRVLGTRFAALHLRRTDFATHCLRPGFRCWLPLSQIARCVADRINALNAAAGVAGATAASGGGSAAAVAVAAGVKEGAASSGMEQHQTVRTLFVATDTTDQELRWFTQMLKSLVWGEITVIQYPRSKSAAPGAAELQAAGIIAHSSTRGTVEKMVCVHALVFWGTPRSTWSKDVLRMRGALGVEHCGDDWVCGGEETEDLGVREISKRMNA